MRKIAVINQKGGVGKTTTAANLGAALARAGKRVLLVDLDPQGHLGLHFGLELREDQSTIYDVLVEETPLADVVVEATHGLYVAPSNIDLAGAETELVSVLGREVLLRDALARYDGGFDCLLIDCPPSLGVLTINALVAVDELVIPLQAQFFALQGFSKLLDKTVRLVCQRINPKLRVLGVVLCMHESNTRLSGEVAEDIASFLEAARGTPTAWSEAKVFDAFIRRNIKLAEASSFGQSVFDYAPKSNGARDYERLASEIFGDAVASADAHGAVAADSPVTPASKHADTTTPRIADASRHAAQTRSPVDGVNPNTTLSRDAELRAKPASRGGAGGLNGSLSRLETTPPPQLRPQPAEPASAASSEAAQPPMDSEAPTADVRPAEAGGADAPSDPSPIRSRQA